jgi:hypothetical protein
VLVWTIQQSRRWRMGVSHISGVVVKLLVGMDVVYANLMFRGPLREAVLRQAVDDNMLIFIRGEIDKDPNPFLPAVAVAGVPPDEYIAACESATHSYTLLRVIGSTETPLEGKAAPLGRRLPVDTVDTIEVTTEGRAALLAKPSRRKMG